MREHLKEHVIENKTFNKENWQPEYVLERTMFLRCTFEDMLLDGNTVPKSTSFIYCKFKNCDIWNVFLPDDMIGMFLPMKKIEGDCLN